MSSSSLSNNRYGSIDPTVVEAFESLSFDSEDDNNNSNSNSNNNTSNNIIKNNNKKIQNSTVFNKMKRAVSSLPAIAVILSFSIIAAFLLIKSEYNISIFKASNQSFNIDTTTSASNLRSSSRGGGAGIGAAPSVIATAPSASR